MRNALMPVNFQSRSQETRMGSKLRFIPFSQLPYAEGKASVWIFHRNPGTSASEPREAGLSPTDRLAFQLCGVGSGDVVTQLEGPPSRVRGTHRGLKAHRSERLPDKPAPPPTISLQTHDIDIYLHKLYSALGRGKRCRDPESA